MSASRWTIIGVSVLLLLAISALFVLPALQRGVYLSPDETANAVIARRLAETGRVAIPDQIIPHTAWVHPRSFVGQAGSLLPVGFLGMSLVLGIMYKISGTFGMNLFTPLLVISVLYPLWTWSRRWGLLGQIATLLGWLSFPTVILYANRGLFSGLAVVCLTLWACWCLHRSRSAPYLVIAGALVGLALAMRPIESIWIVPWLWLARSMGEGRVLSRRMDTYDALLFFFPLGLIAGGFAWLGSKAYGSWFTAGYQLRDMAAVSLDQPTHVALNNSDHVQLIHAWPFGFHPRAVWHNVRAYFFSYLWPWVALTIGVGIAYLRQRVHWRWIAVVVWTCTSLSLVYGQALYQDHVRFQQVAVANSFLRYVLPLSVFFAFALGWCVFRLSQLQKHGRIAAIALILIMCGSGYWTAFFRDDEGLWQNTKELQKYSDIRQQAVRVLDPDTVVLSDRSDKIFFPVFRAVSPLPETYRIMELLQRQIPVAIFLRTQTTEQLEIWKTSGIELQRLFQGGNESLYIARLRESL